MHSNLICLPSPEESDFKQENIRLLYRFSGFKDRYKIKFNKKYTAKRCNGYPE